MKLWTNFRHAISMAIYWMGSLIESWRYPLWYGGADVVGKVRLLEEYRGPAMAAEEAATDKALRAAGWILVAE